MSVMLPFNLYGFLQKKFVFELLKHSIIYLYLVWNILNINLELASYIPHGLV